MVMAAICLCEVLCFVKNKFHVFTREKSKSIIVNFYTEDELLSARDVLLADAATTAVEGLPRCARRKGDNRVKLIVDDLLDIMTILDESKVIDKLPTYAAHALDRIPVVSNDDLDLFCLSQRLEGLAKQVDITKGSTAMDGVLRKLDYVSQEVDKLSAELRMTHTRLANIDFGMRESSVARAAGESKADDTVPTDVAENSSQWSDMAATGFDLDFPRLPKADETRTVGACTDPASWTLVSRRRPSSPKKPASKPALRLCGTKVT